MTIVPTVLAMSVTMPRIRTKVPVPVQVVSRHPRNVKITQAGIRFRYLPIFYVRWLCVRFVASTFSLRFLDSTN